MNDEQEHDRKIVDAELVPCAVCGAKVWLVTDIPPQGEYDGGVVIIHREAHPECCNNNRYYGFGFKKGGRDKAVAEIVAQWNANADFDLFFGGGLRRDWLKEQKMKRAMNDEQPATTARGKVFTLHEKTAGGEWWQEFQTEEQRHRYIVESRIWAHYDHAREKHPYFCDTLLSSTLPPTYHEEVLTGTRRMLLTEQSFNQLRALSLLECEEDELKLAISRDDISNAIEEAYDCIAVLLRVIDVLEGRQPLGRPEEGAAK